MPTVLIADDDADHRDLMTFALTRGGHRVVAAVDAAAAMTELLSGEVDVALLDVRMPGESGIDLCRRLRAQPVTALLPIMLVSADVNDRHILTALYAGADDFMPKPFRRAEICARLDNLLLRKHGIARRPARVASARTAAVRPPRPVSALTA
ncbi:response regulator transcription factor [Actinoplanes solisilvae]|uniref:response regulator transcription factor n=1 Tax=Actinoplanes solisilvae TaxID=2486853 RepID=UPI000FD9B5F9|nr:response regulator [Actinoplanes solisilvae]